MNAELTNEAIKFCYGPSLSVLSECMRGFMEPAPGHVFIAGDFSAVEARVTAALGGDDKELNVFRSGKCIYKYTASLIYGIPYSEVTSEQRQIGKVAVLSMGFGGGVGAFQQMAKNYLVKVPDSVAESVKTAWRESHPKIVAYWHTLERAAMNAINNPGQIFKAGKISYVKKGSFLWCQLPSSRVICYPYPKIEAALMKWGEIKDVITIMANDTYEGWSRQKIWYGTLIENAVQGTSRCLLTEAMFRVEARGYKIVMHSHDEIVAEVPKDFGSVDEFCGIMSENPTWMTELPIEVKGWAGGRYKK